MEQINLAGIALFLRIRQLIHYFNHSHFFLLPKTDTDVLGTEDYTLINRIFPRNK